MSVLRPELLLLALPLGWLLVRTTPVRSWRFVLRALGAAALVVAAAGPLGGGATTGRDLVVLVDRSRSMPGGVAKETGELVDLLAGAARPGDRIAVLSFGEGVSLDQPLGPPEAFTGFRAEVDADGSRLADAIDRALSLIPEDRPGSVLVLSDGEFHGASPEDAARRAALRGVRVDARSAERSATADVSVDGFDLPEAVGVGEPFQFGAWVRSDRALSVDWRLLRGEEVIASGRRELERGVNQMVFRDVAGAAGLASYRLVVDAAEDGRPENDAGLGVVRVEGGRPLLLVNATGEAGRLAQALRAAGIPVVVRGPDALARAPVGWLDGFAGVVLENVEASALGEGLGALAVQVADLGAGLLVTGGRASFGVGGYYGSRLEPVLPVSMELRVEHRKMALALAVVLDRSGSMGVQVASGLTKMDLANAGAIESMRLLGSIDEVAVVAVDSSPHVVVPLQPVDDLGGLVERVSGIRSMGGGIFTYTGLLAAAHELEGAAAGNRHVILFADANDAEEPGEYVELLRQLTAERSTTVSVVALGTTSDADAAFLEDVAARGGGEAYFTQSPQELPRLFAQDTLLAARSAFIEEPVGTEALAALLAVTPDVSPGPWGVLPGYNLCYARPEATVGVRTTDEFAAPVVVTMQAGLGRSACFTGQVDGGFGVPDERWPEVARTLVTLARWVAEPAQPEALFPSSRREGREAVLSVEVDRAVDGGSSAGPVRARVVRPDGLVEDVVFSPVSDERYEARVALGGEGVYRFAAETESGELLAFPPVAVPYSPEFEARGEPDEGRRVLGRLTRLGRGRMNPPVHEAFAGERRGRGTRPLSGLFALAGLALLLAEIVWRRWYERRAAPSTTAAREPTVPSDAERSTKSAGPRPVPTARPRAHPSPTSTDRGPRVPAAPAPAAEEQPTLDDALKRLKRDRRR